jgi:hypothetical protein
VIETVLINCSGMVTETMISSVSYYGMVTETVLSSKSCSGLVTETVIVILLIILMLLKAVFLIW